MLSFCNFSWKTLRVVIFGCWQAGLDYDILGLSLWHCAPLGDISETEPGIINSLCNTRVFLSLELGITPEHQKGVLLSTEPGLAPAQVK